MGVGIYYFYHGFGLKAFEGRHIRIRDKQCLYQYIYIYIGYSRFNSLFETEDPMNNLKKSHPIDDLWLMRYT